MILALTVGTALAQDEGHWSDDDAGWGDEDDGWGEEEDGWGEPSAPADPVKPPSPLSFDGQVSTEEALWIERLDEEPLAKARQSLDLGVGFSKNGWRARVSGHAEVDPVYLRDGVDPSTRATYGWQARPGEAWVATSFGPVDLSVGRQEVAWGKGNVLGLFDRVNPKDLREPGLADLDDVRLPVTMFKAAFFAGDHKLEAIVVPEADWGYRSPPDGPFGLLPGLLEHQGIGQIVADGLISKEYAWVHLQDRWGAEVIQGFGSWTWSGKGVDLGLYGASALDQQGVIVGGDDPPNLLGDDIAIPIDHRRSTLFGHAGAATVGGTVLRWEAAGELGRAVNVGDVVALDASGLPTFDAQTAEIDAYTGLVGVSYAGLPRTTLDLEVSGGYVPDKPDDMLLPWGELQYAVRAQHKLLRERLALTAAGGGIGPTLAYGLLVRADVAYELADGLRANLGWITYQPGEELGPLVGLETHDRVFGGVHWSF